MADSANQQAAQGGVTTPEVGTAEYRQAMIDKANGLDIRSVSTDGTDVQQLGGQDGNEDQANDNTSERPSWLPEKFKSPEELAASYAELEKKLAAPQDNQQQDNKDNNQENTEVPPGVDIAKFSQEFEANGELSEASYAELAKTGITKEMVDAYIEGQMVIAERYQQSGFDVVGGKDNYEAMTTWAKANLTKAELAAFNSSVGSGNVDTMKLAIQGMHSKFIAANGSAPRTSLAGSSAASSPTGSFQSRAQIVEAMSDPRYQTDPAYRQQVRNRIAASNVI